MEFPASNNANALPLFPAYSASIQNEKVKRDWLCNSSFTEATLKEVSSQLVNHQNTEGISKNIDPVLDEVESTEVGAVSEQKKSHKKRKYERYSISAFSVPQSESILWQLKKKTFIEETGLSYERAFQTDAKGDHENLMYESFERTKIASYRPCIKIPIGLSAEELSVWSENLLKTKEKIPVRYFNKSFLKTMKMVNPEKIWATKEPLHNLCLNYIPVSVSSNCAEKSQSLPNFINVSSSWKLQNTKKEFESENEKCDNELRTETIYYNKMLSEDPNNIEMWMEFIDFQDKIFLSENTNCIKNLTEKKMAILEKALKHNPKNVRLNILKLKLCENLYPDKLNAMWEELVFYNPNKPEVWQEYLLYAMSNLTVFNISSILKIYGNCLQTLMNVCEGITQSHESYPDIVPNMLEILNQLCYFLRSCGYTEKAIAIYQAFIEFNLFYGASIKDLTVCEKIACFEPFWDSGAPRIGEKNALGWATTVQQKQISFDYLSTDSDLNSMEDEILAKNLSVSKTWLEFERLREMHHWLPWRPNPEYDQTKDDVDDVDRIVPFDDVSKFLFCVQEYHHRFLLIMNFITFLGFDPHLLGCHGNKVISNPYNLEEYENILNQLRKDSLFQNIVDPFPVNTHWNEEKCDFINNIFLQVVDAFSPKYRTLCTFMYIKYKQYVALDIYKKKNEKDIADLKKSVMRILKKAENRNCLLLWLEYIYIEWLIDKSSAMSTFQMLLKSSISAVSEGNMEEQELWYFAQSFVEFYMNNEKNISNRTCSANEILWILIHIANKEKYIPYSGQEIKSTVILKTVSRFKSALDSNFSSLDSTQSLLCYCFDPCSYSLINCAKCLAYFQYFSQGLEAAMQVYESAISFLDMRDLGFYGRCISEQMSVAQAKILNYHTWNSTLSVKSLQTFLYSSIKKYPHSSQLLYLLVKLRSASSVINPTRRFLAQIMRTHCKNHPVTWFFVLLTELAICSSLLLQKNPDGDFLTQIVSNLGINWRIRSLYEKMLQSDACAHISVLWRSYFKFELMTQNTEKAKSVYHRALQNCGWSKELLMEVIEHFPSELEEILAFMSEKQIRIHTPLEEVTLLREHASVADS